MNLQRLIRSTFCVGFLFIGQVTAVLAQDQPRSAAHPGAGEPDHGTYWQPPTPPASLGVYADTGYVWTGYQWEPGVRIRNVWPGWPAWGRLDPGDIVTRVNGVRVRDIYEFRQALASSGGVVNLRVRDIRTGQMMNMYPIALGSGGYGSAEVAPYTPTRHIVP